MKIALHPRPSDGPKSGYRVATEGMRFSRPWNDGTVFYDLGVIWEMSVEYAVRATMLRLALVLTVVLLAASAFAQPALTLTPEEIKAALVMDHRNAENRARDKNRDPIRAMRFCRLRDDMTVIEFGPGSGWYTEILDPVRVIHEVLTAGFVFVDYSDMFFKADDELRYEVGRPTVKGNTDRFAFLFRKPVE
jgi:predicted methyltransferase